MASIAVVCSDCKRITREARRGRCSSCFSTWERGDGARRRTHPRHLIYKDKRWLTAARACLTRDHWRCVDCGRHRTELGPNERLGADHVIPVLECDDPFDVDNLQARCSTCSGVKDGKRAHA